MDFDAICKKIKGLDSRIRFAGIVNNQGRLVAGGMKEDKKPLEDTKDDEMLFMELVLRTKMRKEFDKQLGAVKFAMSYREKAIVMSFPFGEHVMLVSAEREIDFAKIPFKILKILES
ncbi:MAG TPA: DUF6659 family protein [Nitrosopumilaceae archaeon]|nr:DUF6659 family protein [Nitrosopumilaceae archaeon]